MVMGLVSNDHGGSDDCLLIHQILAQVLLLAMEMVTHECDGEGEEGVGGGEGEESEEGVEGVEAWRGESDGDG